MMPMMSHIRWPVIKLPGSTPEPCRIQTPPARIAITPRIKLPMRIQVQYALALHASRYSFKLPRVIKREGAPSKGWTAHPVESLRNLGFGRNGFGRNDDLFARAAAGFVLGQRHLPDVEPLDGRQVAERPQEVLAATTLHDSTQLVLETLDAFHERDAEGIGDPCALRTELLLHELLGIAR